MEGWVDLVDLIAPRAVIDTGLDMGRYENNRVITSKLRSLYIILEGLELADSVHSSQKPVHNTYEQLQLQFGYLWFRIAFHALLHRSSSPLRTRMLYPESDRWKYASRIWFQWSLSISLVHTMRTCGTWSHTIRQNLANIGLNHDCHSDGQIHSISPHGIHQLTWQSEDRLSAVCLHNTNGQRMYTIILYCYYIIIHRT